MILSMYYPAFVDVKKTIRCERVHPEYVNGTKYYVEFASSALENILVNYLSGIEGSDAILTYNHVADYMIDGVWSEYIYHDHVHHWLSKQKEGHAVYDYKMLSGRTTIVAFYYPSATGAFWCDYQAGLIEVYDG